MTELSKIKFPIESVDIDSFNRVRAIAENHLPELLKSDRIELGKEPSKNCFMFLLKKDYKPDKVIIFPDTGTQRGLDFANLNDAEVEMRYGFKISDDYIVIKLPMNRNRMLEAGIEFRN